MAKEAAVYRLNGRVVTRRAWLKNSRGITPGTPQGPSCDLWRNSEALSLSVLPSQVNERREQIRKMGLMGITYDDNGTCRRHGKRAWTKFYKAMGCHNKDAGYGE